MRILRPLARAYNTFQAFKRFSGVSDNQRELLKKHMAEWEDGFSTAAGVNVDEKSGLKQDTVFRCINVISATVAQTPSPVFERLERGRRKAREHSLHRVLNVQANRHMTAFTWKKLTVSHVLSRGNAFSEIERNNRGDVIALNPMHPKDVKIEGRLPSGEIVYKWTDKNHQTFLLPERRVLHLRDVTWDGILGVSRIVQLKELIGRTKAREEFQSRFYSNGANLGGAITTPDELTDEQLERHRQSFEKLYKGNKNAHKVLLLEGAEKYEPIGISPREAEFAKTAQLDRAAIASAFGCPLQLINDLETGASRASAEQLFREFLMLGLQEQFCNLEQQINLSLLRESERDSLFVEFVREALLQADTTSLMEALKVQVQSTILTPNQAREKLNLNPEEGGDVLLAPVNMLPVTELGRPRTIATRQDGGYEVTIHRETEPPAKRSSQLGRRRVIRSSLSIFQDAFERIGKRERQDVRRAVKKQLRDAQGFFNFLEDYYREDASFAEFVRRTLTPIASSLSASIQEEIRDELATELDDDGKQFVREYVAILAFRYTSSSRRQLEKVLAEVAGRDEPSQAIEQRIAEWENGTTEENPPRAQKEATRESSRLGNALSRHFYLVGGVLRLVWRTVGKNCPLCNQLDGKTVGIRERFLAKGDSVEAEGTAPLRAESDVLHPPLHAACDCLVIPG